METEIGKDKIKIPINAYDIFGYFLPGVVLVISILSFEFWVSYQPIEAKPNSQEVQNEVKKSGVHIPAYTAIKAMAKIVLSKKDWVFSASFFGIILMIIYVCGHIISSVSSFFIDRGLVLKGYAYPYQTLLDLDEPIRKTWATRSYYRGLFFWINVYLLIRYWNTISPLAVLKITASSIGYTIVLVTIIKILLSIYISNRSVRKRLNIPSYYKIPVYYFLKFLFKNLFAGFYDVVTSFISRFINTRQSFDKEFKKSFSDMYKKQFALHSRPSDSNNYWLPVCYIADKSQILNSMMAYWLHMYSYARNIATAFYLAFLYCFISIFTQPTILKIKQAYVIEYLPIIFFCISLIMLQRYYYLYFSYYSKFIYRAFHYLQVKDTILTKSEA